MDYLLSFIEGIITFVSPCLLPMLPIYISYFAGGEASDQNKRKQRTLINAIGFVFGFTIVFLLLGAAAGTFGIFVRQNQIIFNVIGGLILILFGLNFMSVIKIGFLSRTLRIHMKVKSFHFISSVLLGIVFSIGWTPCVGAFLGSALMLAANSHEAFKGIMMLLLFSLGLGIPFVISAVLIDSLKQTFDAIKRHYKVISIISGLLLILVGVLMMFGRLNAFLSILTFR
jgi:cytochrome c-type biogenesis protein